MAENRPTPYGPIITGCKTGEHRCSNCDYRNPNTAWCIVRSKIIKEPETSVCAQWLEERKQPVFGGTSLSELEEKAKVWSKQQEAVAIDYGVQQGMTLEMLDTVFDIACQQVPSCKERWMKLKDKLHFPD